MCQVQICLGEIPLRLKMCKAHSTGVTELETHQRDASAANLELLGREVNLFTEKREVDKPGEFDHLSDEELMKLIESQSEVVRELERQLLPPPAPKQRKGATTH
jgi:hypothetical protein